MIEKFKRENIIERENQSVVTGYYKPNIALIITGLRRTGKSVFSFSVLKGENFGYANFDDERLSDLNANDMNRCLKRFIPLTRKPSSLMKFRTYTGGRSSSQGLCKTTE